MVLSQTSNKFHRSQQITKRGKVNVQRKTNGKNDHDILISLDIYMFLYKYMYCCYYYYCYYYYYYYHYLLTANAKCFLNKLCKVCISTNQVFKTQ